MENHSLNVTAAVTALLHHCQFGVTFRAGGGGDMQMEPGGALLVQPAVPQPHSGPLSLQQPPAASTTPTASAHKLELCSVDSRSAEREEPALNLRRDAQSFSDVLQLKTSSCGRSEMSLAKSCVVIGLCLSLAEAKFYRPFQHGAGLGHRQGNPTSTHG